MKTLSVLACLLFSTGAWAQDVIYANPEGCRIEVDGTELSFVGCNINVKNGNGQTASANGTGNLVVGYNEGSGLPRGGSHNVVLGEAHRYPSYGGLIAGRGNRTGAPNASVLGGVNNAANRADSVVIGGRDNQASGASSVVAGGHSNNAKGRFSYIAGGLGHEAVGDYASLAAGIATDVLAASVEANSTMLAVHDFGISTLFGWVEGIGNDVDALTAQVGTLADDLADTVNSLNTTITQVLNNQGEIATIGDVVADIDGAGLDDLLSVLSVDGEGDLHVVGANLRIENGTGSTTQPDQSGNSKGNLILGYGEEAPAAPDRTGSHNLILGTEHGYTGVASIVTGLRNTVSGFGAVVSGTTHTVSGGTALGGSTNVVGGNGTAIGGLGNEVSGLYAVAVAGSNNDVTGNLAAVVGGSQNLADGDGAVSVGGRSGNATGPQSVTVGGFGATVSAQEAVSVGGHSSHVGGLHAVVVGGSVLTANGTNSVAVGGSDNLVTGANAVIAAGSFLVEDQDDAFASP